MSSKPSVRKYVWGLAFHMTGVCNIWYGKIKTVLTWFLQSSLLFSSSHSSSNHSENIFHLFFIIESVCCCFCTEDRQPCALVFICPIFGSTNRLCWRCFFYFCQCLLILFAFFACCFWFLGFFWHKSKDIFTHKPWTWDNNNKLDVDFQHNENAFK